MTITKPGMKRMVRSALAKGRRTLHPLKIPRLPPIPSGGGGGGGGQSLVGKPNNNPHPPGQWWDYTIYRWTQGGSWESDGCCVRAYNFGEEAYLPTVFCRLTPVRSEDPNQRHVSCPIELEDCEPDIAPLSIVNI